MHLPISLVHTYSCSRLHPVVINADSIFPVQFSRNQTGITLHKPKDAFTIPKTVTTFPTHIRRHGLDGSSPFIDMDTVGKQTNHQRSKGIMVCHYSWQSVLFQHHRTIVVDCTFVSIQWGLGGEKEWRMNGSFLFCFHCHLLLRSLPESIRFTVAVESTEFGFSNHWQHLEATDKGWSWIEAV